MGGRGWVRVWRREGGRGNGCGKVVLKKVVIRHAVPVDHNGWLGKREGVGERKGERCIHTHSECRWLCSMLLWLGTGYCSRSIHGSLALAKVVAGG